MSCDIGRRTMLLCLSRARVLFRWLFSWGCGVVFPTGLMLGCGQDRDGPLRGGGAQALIRSRPAGRKAEAGDGRRIVRRPAGAAAGYWARACPEFAGVSRWVGEGTG